MIDRASCLHWVDYGTTQFIDVLVPDNHVIVIGRWFRQASLLVRGGRVGFFIIRVPLGPFIDLERHLGLLCRWRWQRLSGKRN